MLIFLWDSETKHIDLILKYLDSFSVYLFLSLSLPRIYNMNTDYLKAV